MDELSLSTLLILIFKKRKKLSSLLTTEWKLFNISLFAVRIDHEIVTS